MVVRRAVFIQSLIVVVSVLFNMQGNVVVSMKLIVYFLHLYSSTSENAH